MSLTRRQFLVFIERSFRKYFLDIVFFLLFWFGITQSFSIGYSRHCIDLRSIQNTGSACAAGAQ